MRIVVTGLCATYPFGGVFWDYVQYLLGFQRMGHEVLYLEDTGRASYDPRRQTFIKDGSANAAVFQRHLDELDSRLAARWFYRDANGTVYGMPWAEAAAFCRSADLFLQVSASTMMRDEYFAAERRVYLDSDPMYTPATRPCFQPETRAQRKHMEWTRAHDVFFTFGENVGAPECRIPRDEFDWQPTRQPIVMDCFREASVPVGRRRRVMTTVGSWEPGNQGPTIDGVPCGGKRVEFEKYMVLPSSSPLPMELALSGKVPTRMLSQWGWRVRDAWPVSRDPWTYRRYLARSFCEWSVAKNAYVFGRTGWFSCRSACYLALGVPTVVQDTGFRRRLPAGEGLLAFSSLDEAAQAAEAVVADPDRHSRAAIELAREYFDSNKVLGDLLDRAFAAERKTPPVMQP